MTLLAEAPLLDTHSDGEQPTLGALVSGMWGELAIGRTAPCPVCHGEMEPEYGQHARPIWGRCGECGSTLA